MPNTVNIKIRRTELSKSNESVVNNGGETFDFGEPFFAANDNDNLLIIGKGDSPTIPNSPATKLVSQNIVDGDAFITTPETKSDVGDSYKEVTLIEADSISRVKSSSDAHKVYPATRLSSVYVDSGTTTAYVVLNNKVDVSQQNSGKILTLGYDTSNNVYVTYDNAPNSAAGSLQAELAKKVNKGSGGIKALGVTNNQVYIEL